MLPSKCTILKCSRLELCLLSCHVAMQYISGQRTLPARLQSVVGLSPPPRAALIQKVQYPDICIDQPSYLYVTAVQTPNMCIYTRKDNHNDIRHACTITCDADIHTWRCMYV